MRSRTLVIHGAASFSSFIGGKGREPSRPPTACRAFGLACDGFRKKAAAPEVDRDDRQRGDERGRDDDCELLSGGRRGPRLKNHRGGKQRLEKIHQSRHHENNGERPEGRPRGRPNDMAVNSKKSAAIHPRDVEQVRRSAVESQRQDDDRDRRDEPVAKPE